MNRELVKQLNEKIAEQNSYEERRKKISILNMEISDRINKFMLKTLTASTIIVWILLFLLFYIQSFVLPHPGITIELSMIMVLLPIISVIIYLISNVDKSNWKSKKSLFDLIPTFTKQKKDFTENDPDIKKFLSEIEYLSKPSNFIANYSNLNIPVAYTNKDSLSKIRSIITNGRADSLKEAINIYEQEKAFSQRDKTLRDQNRKIEELENAINEMDRQENRRTADLKRQRAASEHNIRKSIDDFRRYK